MEKKMIIRCKLSILISDATFSSNSYLQLKQVAHRIKSVGPLVALVAFYNSK